MRGNIVFVIIVIIAYIAYVAILYHDDDKHAKHNEKYYQTRMCNNLNGISITNATKSLTARSPKERVTQGNSVPAKAIEKNKKVSIIDPIDEDISGATYQLFFLSLSKIWTSSNCATKKAEPEPIAILIDIRSAKFVEKNKVNKIPIKKPK